ncbi:hypothetical protein BFJ68_g9931 [Fusarium oxysporum]|uniref:Uncharacterized protein n=1 Tax=Fusarium oxysporum TaxID=5507 RepID=A0A420PEF3_FUSOX|nr:hypothetical protein BFJ71_g11274 [Fusarium oxysporum]RKL07428.1 hypothetical protein BFJ68_g9931 [Fusarium oxysporum]
MRLFTPPPPQTPPSVSVVAFFKAYSWTWFVGASSACQQAFAGSNQVNWSGAEAASQRPAEQG